jgi:hypothetical protein
MARSTVLALAVGLSAVVLSAQAPQPQPAAQAPPATQQPPAQPAPATDQTPQPQQPVFRTGINFVRVDVIITDPKGNPVGDLKP